MFVDSPHPLGRATIVEYLLPQKLGSGHRKHQDTKKLRHESRVELRGGKYNQNSQQHEPDTTGGAPGPELGHQNFRCLVRNLPIKSPSPSLQPPVVIYSRWPVCGTSGRANPCSQQPHPTCPTAPSSPCKERTSQCYLGLVLIEAIRCEVLREHFCYRRG